MSDWERDEQRWSEWLVQAQGGDRDAYGALLTELSAAIRGYVISRFGRLDNLDDCVQESLLAIHEARHTYDGARPFRPWLFAIVRNRTIDLMRHGQRQARLEEAAAFTNEPPASEPIHAIDTGRVLAALSKNLRDTLILTKFLGLSTREAAARQGVSESVVKVRVHRGIKKLRSLLDAEGDTQIDATSDAEYDSELS